MSDPATTCPACGGSGGGPFGRAGSAWDVEGYLCPRCAGRGVLGVDRPVASARPLAKGHAPAAGGAAMPRLAHTKPPAKRARAAVSGHKKQ